MRRLSSPYWHTAGHVVRAVYSERGLTGEAVTLADAEAERLRMARETLDLAKRGEDALAVTMRGYVLSLHRAITQCRAYRRMLSHPDLHSWDRRASA